MEDHPILNKPWEYRVTDFRYSCDSDFIADHFIDMTLKKGNEIVILRFTGPINLMIEEGFPAPTLGMEFLDISDRNWENLSIQVGNFENSSGAIRFYAKDVKRINAL